MSKTNAAILTGLNQPWKVAEIDVGEPNAWEVEVQMAYAGLRHSDEHMRDGVAGLSKEALAFIGVESIFPLVGGHEGSGVVIRVGERVADVAPGDHVAVCFIPSCGRCRWCARGDQQLCDRGIYTLAGPMISDGTYRYHLDGQPMNRMSQLGTFAEGMVCHENSVIKIDPNASLNTRQPPNHPHPAGHRRRAIPRRGRAGRFLARVTENDRQLTWRAGRVVKRIRLSWASPVSGGQENKCLIKSQRRSSDPFL